MQKKKYKVFKRTAHMSTISSHVFFLIFLIIVIIIIVRLLFGLLGLFLGLLLLVFLFLLGLLHFIQGLPLASEGISFSHIVSDDDVVKDGLGLDLPEIESNETKICVLVHSIVINIFRIVDFLGFPDTFVLWVGDSLGLPVTLVIWIVLHGGLPFTILL